MILYHGSADIVNTPEIRSSNRALDYGSGFYTTTLIAELKAYTLVDQYLFHTEKSLNAIKFIEAKEVIKL